jgi:signal transduction histidine kinase
VTHELRTPLTTFRMYAEMLAEEMVADDATRRQYCETLRGEADRLSHLVENVLAYARLERGGLGCRKIRLTIDELLRVSTERLATRAAQSEFELVIEAAAELRTVELRTDPVAVEQILFNLVDNAAKYAAAAVERKLRLSLLQVPGFLLLRVCDQGPGVRRAELGMLFEPFRKSAAAAAATAPGVGLGLALSRRLARDMGGDLKYLEPAGGGACFELQLPMAAE